MAIKHSKVSGKADGADAALVRPSDWNAAHTIDGVTANNLPKVAGGSLVDSAVSDDGTGVTITRQVGIGAAVPVAYRQLQVTNTDPTLEEGAWIQCTAAAHVGTAANQAINLVLRQAGTTNTGGGAATATCIDAAVTQTKSAGASALTNTAVLANASGGTTNYSWFSSNGQMVQTGDAHFGALEATSIVNSGALNAGASTLGATTVAGLLTAGVSPTGSTHVFNGNLNVRSDAADTWIELRNTAAGGRDYFIEASGNAGTDPNCVAIYDNTAGATRFKINSSGHVIATVKLGVGASLWTSGTGSPEGVVTGNKGDMYSRTDGGAATCFYIKETTGGNTGWVAK